MPPGWPRCLLVYGAGEPRFKGEINLNYRDRLQCNSRHLLHKLVAYAHMCAAAQRGRYRAERWSQAWRRLQTIDTFASSSSQLVLQTRAINHVSERAVGNALKSGHTAARIRRLPARIPARRNNQALPRKRKMPLDVSKFFSFHLLKCGSRHLSSIKRYIF